MGVIWFLLGCACGYGIASLRRAKLLESERDLCREFGKMEQKMWQEAGVNELLSNVVDGIFSGSTKESLRGLSRHLHLPNLQSQIQQSSYACACLSSGFGWRVMT